MAASSTGDVESGTNTTHDLTPLQCVNQDWVLRDELLFVSHNCDLVDALGIAVLDLKSGTRSTGKEQRSADLWLS